MFEELENIVFSQECEVHEDIQGILIHGECIVHSYNDVTNIISFTNKRLVVRIAKGITGKKSKIYVIPYKCILLYSVESGKVASTIELQTKAGDLRIQLDRKVDVKSICKVISVYLL